MAVPFCTGCGATVTEGTRFCVKCGKRVGEDAPPAEAQTAVFAPPAPTPPPPVAETQVRTAQVPAAPVAPPPKSGSSAGVWIGILGILLLVGSAGLWFYTIRKAQSRALANADSSVQVAAAPVQAGPTEPPAPAPPVPAPVSTPDVVPPNPDLAKKAPAPLPAPRRPVSSKPQAVESKPVETAPPPQPAPAPAATAARETSGVLHATVEVAQNGEVVFDNLPGGRLKFTFDHSAWQPTISRQPNGTQTLVMRSLRPGIQTKCDVRWEIIP